MTPTSERREPQVIRRRVLYRGRVQGVGFRYTTQAIAGGFDVTGFVRNLVDGSVELEAQGEMAVVSAFLRAVASRLEANIDDAETSDLTVQPDDRAFTIRPG